MLLQEKDQEAFKRWILPKLETISDVDAEVLADYVIALVTTNEAEADVKRNCIEQLSEFLADSTEPIVNDVLTALKDKSYAKRRLNADAANFTPSVAAPASQSAPIPSVVSRSNYEYEPHPSRATHTPPFGAPKGPAATRAATAAHRLPDRPTESSLSRAPQQDGSRASRKRKLLERETSQTREDQDPHYIRNGIGNRPLKQSSRRGPRNTRGVGLDMYNGFTGMPNMANLPPPPPGPLPFDPTNPMAFFAMAAAFGVSLPGMPPLPVNDAPTSGTSQRGRKARCEDYHTKGFCALGSFCPHEHGDAIAIPADKVPEYHPERAYLAAKPSDRQKRQGFARSGSHGNKAGRRRAEFSAPGPSYDRSNRSIVVEQIPETHFSEEEVRSYFSEFGTITNVQMHAYKRLAVITFEDYDSANRAYMSPKAIFENRFVKVYWYKKESETRRLQEVDGDLEMGSTSEKEESLDMEEIAKRQAEAQRTFDERRRKEEAAAARAEEIERALQAKYEEMRKVKQKLAALSGDKEGEEEFSQSLATLQAEAEDLFAQHDPGAFRGRGRGALRGGSRGRGIGPFPSRGRGYAPFRGSYRGRGVPVAHYQNGRSSVKRLDNRPKRLAIENIEVDSAKDEALRQYLLNVPDCTSIDRHPEQPDTLIITFKERYQAEMFLDDSRNIPNVGKLEFTWVANDAFGGIKASTQLGDAEASDEDSSATVGELEPDVKAGMEQQATGAEADMDVAEDGDQWL